MAFISKGSSKQQPPLEGSERDQWIHRDKLTQIEIQEYRDLGLEPPADLLRRAAESRQQAATREQAQALRNIRSPSPYRYDENEEEEEESHEVHDGHRIDDDDDEGDSDSIFVPVDPRSPEEIAADPYEYGHGSHALRKSNSKIPLAEYSPVPVPQEHLDRGYPLPRKRGASAGLEENGSPGLSYPKTRQRKGSSSSQIVFDSEGDPLASSPVTGPLTPSSPNKQKTPQNRSVSSKSNVSTTKKRPTNARTPSNNARQRAPSLTPSRPGTSSGERPRTAGRDGPEGDPPWLSTMYKPDPRLPPDQQMLPTHAKRLMQEKLEREGTSAQTYDRDFNSLQPFSANDELNAEQARAQAAEEIERGASPSVGDRTARWPLSQDFSVGGAISPVPSPRKSTANTASGGYEGSPRLTDSPKPQIGLFPSPRIGGVETPEPIRQPSPMQTSPIRQQQGQVQPTRVEGMGMHSKASEGMVDEEKQEKKEKGGCACCVVM